MKSGFITLIGRPNSGKSTLINCILNQKIAIVSDKPQTTRNRITGILNGPDYQMIFLDTPGIHKPKHQLGKMMNDHALGSIAAGDVIYYVVDASQSFGGGEAFILNTLKSTSLPVFLLLNKIDLLEKDDILGLIATWKDRYDFAEIFPISALENDGVQELLAKTETYLTEGPRYYPEDQITDQPEKVIVAELIREKIFQKTHEEIPHSTACYVELMERREKDDKLVIHAVIYVDRPSQKGMIIGKGGRLIKEIGIEARRDIEMLFDEEVYLKLWVKVQNKWRDRQNILRELGFNEEDY